jgi:hypothetical protein
LFSPPERMNLHALFRSLSRDKALPLQRPKLFPFREWVM